MGIFEIGEESLGVLGVDADDRLLGRCVFVEGKDENEGKNE